jgi:hypothetical protein
MVNDPIVTIVGFVGLFVIFVIAVITNSSEVFVLGLIPLVGWTVLRTLRRVRSREQRVCVCCGKGTRWRGRGRRATVLLVLGQASLTICVNHPAAVWATSPGRR